MSFIKIGTAITNFISQINPDKFHNKGWFFAYVGEWIGNLFTAFGQLFVTWFYWICKWLLAFVDFLQYFIQKLIGLDYWLNNNAYTLSGATDNDILFSFLFDETVQRVFRAMLAIFAVLLILFTIVAIIRQEWQYITGEKFGDGRSNSKASIIKNSLKAIALVIVFPLILGIGIISSNAILASLVKALNLDMASTFGGTIFYISTQSANKYRKYADDDARVATSDSVTFYIVNRDLNGTPFEHSSKYLLKVGNGPYGIRGTDYVVNYQDYLRYITEGVNNKWVDKYTVNSIFDPINPKDEKSFSGYCIKLDVNDQPYYYLVRANDDKKVAMYYYLKNVLKAQLMTDEDSIGASSIKSDLGGLQEVESVNCYIVNKNFEGNGKGDLANACYNTWFYSSVYMKTFGFGASESSVNVNDGAFLNAELGLGNFSSLRVIYNNDIISPYFDGGQFGNVQLQSEYYVMADIIDFIIQTDCKLYMIDATSSSINWNYQGNSSSGYHVDSRWISSKFMNSKTYSYDSLPLVVSYSEECENEFGNVLYMAKKSVSDEIKGSTYVMCWKVSVNGTSRYIPVVNGKTFTDPESGTTYNFKSDYYTSNYRGAVVAKGTFDTSVSSTDAYRGNPTYLKSTVNVDKDTAGNKDEISISENDPYYYEMVRSGGIEQKIAPYDASNFESKSYLISNIFPDIESTTTYDLQKEIIDGTEWYYFKTTTTDGAVNDRAALSSSLIQSLNISMYENSGSGKIETAASYANSSQSLTEKGVTYNDYLFLSYDGFYTIVRADYVNNRFTICNMVIDGVSLKYSPITNSSVDVEPTVNLMTINYNVNVHYNYSDLGINYNGDYNDLKLKPRDFTFTSSTVKNGETVYLFRTTDAQGVVFDGGTHTLTKYELLNFYFNNSSLVNLAINDDDENVKGRVMFANGSVGNDSQAVLYGNFYYTFYLYNFYTGAVDKADGSYTLKQCSTTSDTVTIENNNVPRPTDEDFTFTIKVNQDNFFWDSRNTSYGLYNGNSYVATVYKNINTEVGSIDDLPTTTTSVLFNGNTYYNILTTNRYADDAGMTTAYSEIKESFITGCYRYNATYNAARLDIDLRLKLIFSWSWRFYLSLGDMDMDRGVNDAGVISTYFRLDEGITFDYFFNNRVNLDTFYIPSSISYWVIVIASILIIKVLGQAIWGVIKRFYEITLYFIAMPAVASTIPLDGGQRFKTSIQQPLFKKVLSTYGVILGINVFFVLLAPVKSISNIFTAEDIATSGSYFLQHLPFNYKVLNLYVYILFILVAFTMINTLPSTISTIVGSDDIHEEGGKVRKQAGEALSSAGKTFSGRGLVEGVQKTWEGAKNIVPGGAIIGGAFKLGKNVKDWASERSAEGNNEGYDGEGGGSGGGAGGSDNSREDGEEEGGETMEGAAENAREEGEEGAGEAQGTAAEVKEMTGMDASVMETGTEAQQAAYQAAQSMTSMSDNEMENMAAEEFNEKMTTKANDVVGSDFNAGAATATAARNGVSAGNAAFAGVASKLAGNADNAAKADAIRSTLSGQELEDFNKAFETDANAAIAAHNIEASADGTVKVDGKMAGAAASKGLLESAMKEATDEEINTALQSDAGASAAASAAVAENLAGVVDVTAGTGLGQRILDIANQNQGMQDAALLNYFNTQASADEKKKFADTYGIAIGEDGKLNEEQAMYAIQNNRDNIKVKNEDGLKAAMADVIKEKAASGEFKVTAWDLQKNADASVTEDLVAKKKAEMANLAEHNILEGASTQQKAQILDNVAHQLIADDKGGELGRKLQDIQDKTKGMSAEDKLKAYEEAGLTELLARTATIDQNLAKDANGNLINTHYEENQHHARTKEEEKAEQELAVEAILADSPESIVNAFANSEIDNKNAIALSAVQDYVKDSKLTDEQALAEVAKTMNLGDLNLQGFSNEDIALAYKTAEKLGDTANFKDYLDKVNGDPTALLENIKDKDNVGFQSVKRSLMSNLTPEQKQELAENAASSGYLGLSRVDQKNALANLALRNGEIEEQMKAAGVDTSKISQVRAWLDKNQDVKDNLEVAASKMTYLELKGMLNGESNADIYAKVQERAAHNKKVDALMRAEGDSVTAEQAQGMLEGADKATQDAFISEYVDKANVIDQSEQEKLRKDAVATYLKNKNGKDATPEEIADALANDVSAQNAADEAVVAEAKKRLASGLGGRNAFVAAEVEKNTKLMKKIEQDFRREFAGMELSDADELTRNAYLAKYESKLNPELVGTINNNYLNNLQKLGVVKDDKQFDSLMEGLSEKNLGGSDVDNYLMEKLGLRTMGSIALDENKVNSSIISQLSKDTDAFSSIFNSMGKNHGQEGVDLVNNLKRGYLEQQLNKGAYLDAVKNDSVLSSQAENDYKNDQIRLTVENDSDLSKKAEEEYLKTWKSNKLSDNQKKEAEARFREGLSRSQRNKVLSDDELQNIYVDFFDNNMSKTKRFGFGEEVKNVSLENASEQERNSIYAKVLGKDKTDKISLKDADAETQKQYYSKYLSQVDRTKVDLSKLEDIDIVPDTGEMSAKDKRDFDYNKGMLTKQVLQEGRIDLLKNVFDNTNILNKAEIEKKISDEMAKGLSSEEAFEKVVRETKGLQDKLLSLGAQDITRSLDKNTQEQKNFEAVKASDGLKNDLMAFINQKIKDLDKIADPDKKNEELNKLIEKYDISIGANLDNLEFIDLSDKGIKAAIEDKQKDSSTFAKSVHDNVVSKVSYAGNASEEEKQRFFETEAMNLSPSKVEGVRKKAKNMKEAIELFALENGGGVGGVALGAVKGVGSGFKAFGKGIKEGTAHAFKGVLFKVTKKAPKYSTAYDNWNRELQKQIKDVENNHLLTRAEKDAQIKVIEAKKVRYKDPENFSKMSPEEQQAYKKQQAQNRQEAFEAGNFNFVKKVGSAVKSVKDAHVLKSVADNIGYSMRFAPFQTEESKVRRKQDMTNAKADIDRYLAGKQMRSSDTFANDDKFRKFAASYGMSEKKIEKMLSGNAKERQEALEHALNIRYRVASKKVAKDNKINPKSYFDGHGIGRAEDGSIIAGGENMVYREANKKYLEVKSTIHTPTALKILLPGVSQAAFAIARKATTDSRMRAINKYESDPETASERLKKRYDKIYGKRTDESVIRAQNDVINAKNMMAEMQKFNTTFKGSQKDYMNELYKELSKKFGTDLTNRMMSKIRDEKGNFNISNAASLRTKQGWLAKADIANNLSNYALSIQKREIEKALMEQLNQNKRRTQLGSRAIPAPASSAGEFIGKTMTNAKTQTELNRDKINAEHLNKMLSQISSQKNLVSYNTATRSSNSSIDSATLQQFERKYAKKLANADDPTKMELLQQFLRKELEKANNKVHNNGFAKSRKSELEKLNGIYIDRKEINHSGLSASMMTAIKTQNSEVYKNLTKQYNSANAKHLTEQINYNQLAASLKNLQGLPASPEIRKEIAKTKRAIAESEIKLKNLKTLVDQTRARKVDYEKAFADKQIKQSKVENRNVGYNTSTKITDRYTVPYRRDGVQGQVIPGSQLEKEVNRLMSQFIQSHKSELQKLRTQNIDAQDIKRIVDNASYRLSNDFKQNLYNNKNLIKSIERKLKSDIEKGVSKNRKTNENLNDTRKKLIQMEDQLKLELRKLGIELDDIKLKTDK